MQSLQHNPKILRRPLLSSGGWTACPEEKSNKKMQYNPKKHKKLTCDKVASIVPDKDTWKELVGVYWKGEKRKKAMK